MDKKFGLLGGGVLVLALVAAVGIVYAAYSQSLTINGTANVKGIKWDIHLENLVFKKKYGEVEVITEPTISSDGLSIEGLDATFSKPGETVQYYFNVVNAGDFNAKLSSVIDSTPTCTGTGDNAVQDAENVCKNIGFYVWDDESDKKVDPSTADWHLNINESKTFKLNLFYRKETPVEELAKNPVRITGLGVTLVYTQN